MRYARLLKSIGLLGFSMVAFWAAVGGGVALDRLVFARFVPLGNIPSGAEPDFKLMAEAWNVISLEYVDKKVVQPKKLTYGAIGGMVNALGDTGHSSFLSPDMVKLEDRFVEGNFSGIGAQIRMKDGRVVILAPMEGSPAKRAGLQSGDIILKVNGKDVAGQPLEEVVSRITGKAGTKVSLTILSPKTERTREITVVRASITIHNVTWARVPGTELADIRIAGFSQGAGKDLEKILTQVEDQRLAGIVLDLRDNPGGIFNSAVGIASQFLSSGTVALVKDGKGNIEEVPVKGGGLAVSVPLVVLIDGGTASGAEILAGALQDAHRAPLVGEKTFGTGTVLKSFALSDGSALLLAIAEWLTPSGRVIWHKGIQPDAEVPLPAGVEKLYPEAMKDMNADRFRANGDVQLKRAVKMLLNPKAGRTKAGAAAG